MLGTRSARTTRTALVIGAIAIGGLITGCGGSSSSDNGGTAKEPDGEKIFASAGCGGCHTLDEADSKGQTGPNLNQSKLSQTAIEGKVKSGGAGMPAFGGRLSDAEITAVAGFVAENDASSE